MQHTMSVVAESDDEMMFRCLSCPRQVVVGKLAPKLVVVDEGDFGVPHVGRKIGGLHEAEFRMGAPTAE